MKRVYLNEPIALNFSCILHFWYPRRDSKENIMSSINSENSDVMPQLFAEDGGEKVKMEDTPRLRNKPPMAAPAAYCLGEDFTVWEHRVRRYLRYLDDEGHVDVVLSLLSTEVYRKVCVYDIPENVDELFALLREHAGDGKSTEEYRREFLLRVQKPGEALLEFIRHLRGLALHAYTGKDKHQRERLVLKQFISGVHAAVDKERFRLNPPGDLQIAETQASTLDKIRAEVRETPVAWRREERSNCFRPTTWHRESPRGIEKRNDGRRCYLCNKTGHIVKDCPDRQLVSRNRGKSPIKNAPLTSMTTLMTGTMPYGLVP